MIRQPGRPLGSQGSSASERGYVVRGSLACRMTRDTSVPSLAGLGFGVCFGLRISRPRVDFLAIGHSAFVGTGPGCSMPRESVRGRCTDRTLDPSSSHLSVATVGASGHGRTVKSIRFTAPSGMTVMLAGLGRNPR